MNISFNSLYIRNFGIHKELSINFGKKTFICGQNACGKSTIKKALQFVLNLKGDDGKEITGIRTHDENGEISADSETIAELVLTADNTK